MLRSLVGSEMCIRDRNIWGPRYLGRGPTYLGPPVQDIWDGVQDIMDRTQDFTKKNYVVESGKMKDQLPSQNSFIFYILCSSRAKVFRQNYESYPRYLGPCPRYLGPQIFQFK